MQSILEFHGGAGSVTGSNFLLRSNPDQSGGAGVKILVDCGLFQGSLQNDALNRNPFSFEPASIQVLIVTHAHIDHIGRIPKLVRDGFRGRIVSTTATKSLAHPLLMDNMELLAHAAAREGKPALYEEKDVAAAMRLWEGFPYRTNEELPGGFTLEFLSSAHILGSAMVRLSRGGKAVVFTGDLGGSSPLLPPRDSIDGAQYLLMESVYGDRERKDDEDRHGKLEDVIEETAARGGTLLIPAFSTERTQDLLYEIRTLMVEKRVPSMPVYVDSPLADKVTEAFLANPDFFAPGIAERLKKGEDIFAFPELHFVATAEASRGLLKRPPPQIILAGSGMSNGGRVLSHEEDLLGDPSSTLCIVGYQAAGSLGRQLLEGAKDVYVRNKKVRVRCKVESIFGYSAHLDGPHLLDFVSEAKNLERVFVAMGEPASAMFLAQRIRDYLGLDTTVAETGKSVTLEL